MPERQRMRELLDDYDHVADEEEDLLGGPGDDEDDEEDDAEDENDTDDSEDAENEGGDDDEIF